LTHARPTKPTSTACRWSRQHEFRRRCGASLRSGYALPAQRPTTATHVNNRQRIHLTEAKRCSDKASHLKDCWERAITHRLRVFLNDPAAVVTTARQSSPAGSGWENPRYMPPYAADKAKAGAANPGRCSLKVRS
jgi:hypothetical protein